MATTIPRGWKKIRAVKDFTEYEYSKNGLRAIIGTRGSMPVVGTMVTYLVGSRFEGLGTTGYTHILEHMMFKGSTKYPTSKDGMWQIDANGGLVNATTWSDRTNYFAITEKNEVAKVLDIEADRMRNLILDPKELAAEMKVVWNEYERGENDPAQALDKAVWATAFMGHGYHHSTIGWRGDIEAVTTDKLRHFYDTYYWPNNAVVSMVGDITDTEALTQITKYFGKIPRSPRDIPSPTSREPEQEGVRRVTISRRGGLPKLQLSFKSVETLHEDAPALMVLLNILNGSGGLLETTFTEKGLTEHVMAGQAWFHDPGLIDIHANLTGTNTLEEVEHKMLTFLYGIEKQITPERVVRAKKSIQHSALWEQNGFLNLLSVLNESIANADWTLFLTYTDQIKNVTPKQVQAVAKKYFVEDQLTVGHYVPKK